MLPSDLRDSNEEDVETNGAPPTKGVMTPPEQLGVVILSQLRMDLLCITFTTQPRFGEDFPWDDFDTRPMSASAIPSHGGENRNEGLPFWTRRKESLTKCQPKGANDKEEPYRTFQYLSVYVCCVYYDKRTITGNYFFPVASASTPTGTL